MTSTAAWPVRAALAILVLMAPAHGVAAAQRERSEYEIKAALVYQMCRYVSWSAANLPKKSKALLIAVVGKDPFGKHLDALARGKPIGGRRIRVKRLAADDEVKGVQVLFVSSELTKEQAAKAVARARVAGALTVSDRKDFLEAGGVFELYLESKKVRFDANLVAAGKAKLKLGSKLLRHARRVIRGKR